MNNDGMTIDEYNCFIHELNEQGTRKLDLSKYELIDGDDDD